MPAPPEYHFFHGWLYDSDCFSSLIAELQPETTPIFHNRDYFSEETTVKTGFTNVKTSRIAITHSAGLLFLQEQFSLSDFDFIFSFAGFLHFSQTPDYPAGVPTDNIAALRRAVQTQPQRAFMNFRKHCGESAPETPAYFNTEKALSDLTLIARAEAPALPEIPPNRLYIAHGGRDMIFPLAASLRNRLFFHAQEAITLPCADHLFIMKQPDLCARYIRTRLLARKTNSLSNA